MGAVIGYARVSTDSQSAHDQIVTLKQAGATRVFSEKLSGARSDRPMLHKALALSDGDVLLVTRLDRLARSTRDLLNVLDAVAKAGAISRAWPMPGPTPRQRMAGSCSRSWAAWPNSSAS